MKVRYVGTDPDGVDVSCSGTFLGHVKPDEVLEVPDEVYDSHVWAEELWATVEPAKKTATKKGDS